MTRRHVVLLGCLLSMGVADAQAQLGDLSIRTFGYFQTSFQHQQGKVNFLRNGVQQDSSLKYNSFSVQQLNVFFQTDIARKWRAFVNFEVLNNFSSSRRWGSFNLEEAWLRFRASGYFNLKAGLQIPIFNNLNEIKNRTPLLPDIIRPLVYETSFNEFISISDFTPERAFLQAYGFLSLGEAKLDYAAYLGNSPNVNSQFDNERAGVSNQTGIDTTATMLVGGRLGLRYKALKAGFSTTHDQVNDFQGSEVFFGGPPSRFLGISRIRAGGDLSVHLGRFSFEGEVITVTFDEDVPDLSVDKDFFYATLGYHITEELFVYASYSDTVDRGAQADPAMIDEIFGFKVEIEVPGVGVAYNLNDRIVLKGQYAPVNVTIDCTVGREVITCPAPFAQKNEFNFFAAAVSVLF